MSPGSTLDHGECMIKYNGHKVTANQFAKLMVEDWGSRAADIWHEDTCSVNVPLMTESEISACEDAIDRQISRVRKLLNIQGLWRMVYGNTHFE